MQYETEEIKIYNLYEIICCLLSEMCSELNKKCTTFCIYVILFYSRVLHSIKDLLNSIYTCNATTKTVFDCIGDNYKQLSIYLLQQRIEPSQDAWMCMSWIQPRSQSDENPSNFYSYEAKYLFLNELFSHLYASETELLEKTRCTFLETFEKMYNCNCNMFTIPNVNPIVIMKLQTPDKEKMYICKQAKTALLDLLALKLKNDTPPPAVVASIDTAEDNDNCAIKRSRAKFISVEYSHPKMDHKIDLPIHPEWLISGNELFTPGHILYLLEHLNEPYIFDFEYNIHVMDYNINMFEFACDKCIYIESLGYSLKDIDS